MTSRMWAVGLGASCLLALSALIASVAAGAAHPLLQMACTLFSSVVPLVLIATVERLAGIESDAAISPARVHELDVEEQRRG